MAFDESKAYCQDLVMVKIKNWRLPSRHELVSIVNYETNDPSIDSEFFPKTPAQGFWAADPVESRPYSRWAINFADGNTRYESGKNKLNVRCVAGDQGKNQNFRVLANIVKHQKVIWQKDAPNAPKDHLGARKYCEDLDLGILEDWRLPSVFELSSTIDQGPLFAVILNGDELKREIFWGANPFIESPSFFSWTADVKSGQIRAHHSYLKVRVRCVHGR